MRKLPHRTRLVLFGITLFCVLLGYEYYGKKTPTEVPVPPAVPVTENNDAAQAPSHKPDSATITSPAPPEKPAQNGNGSTRPVEVFAAAIETLHDSVEVLGNARANESVDVRSNVTENIRHIDFEDGEYVVKGQVLALLEQSEEQAQLKGAEAQLAEHERELERILRLLKSKAAAKREAEERQTLVEIARQNVEEIKARIADRTITAPFDGVLGIRQVSVGALVTSGDIITTIDDIHRIKLDFYVPSIFLPQLKEGNLIQAKVEALNDRVFEGKIETINTRIDPVTRSVLVRAILPNLDLSLKPGLLMKINLIRNERESLVVPEEALIQRQNRFYVLVVDDQNTVHEKEVHVGTHYPGKMEILNGIEAGDLVIVRGVHLVRNGQQVEIQKTWDKIRAPITSGL